MAVAESMINVQDARTVAIKACAACGGQLLESDCFCRWCGSLQPDAASDRPVTARYTTSLLVGAKSNLYHRVSGPLVSTMVAGVASGELGERGRWMRRCLMAVISLPIWLMIVLLSPLDAYAAAKNLLRDNQ
ncbi:MAG: hypothetical protein ACJ74G_03215 [Blastocatellia bacterium]